VTDWVALLAGRKRSELASSLRALVESAVPDLQVISDPLARAMVRHGQLLDRVRRFQETYEFIVCAVNQLPPFDATLDWRKEIDGVKIEHYVAWMKSA
jgi:amidase